jgi:KUP system potassium uptake protein
MRDPSALENPFFRLFPQSLLLPAVVLATVATIIASQAVISGAYSLTQQAIQMGLLPRMQIIHTSAHERGQIYVPTVNWLLLVAVVLACIGFGNSSAIASAYGIAVTATMLITTILTYFVVRYGWGFPPWVAIGSTAFFVVLDALLLASCSVKIVEGGWFTLAMAGGVLVVMLTWKRGRELLSATLKQDLLPLKEFADNLSRDHVTLVPRTAVFLSAERGVVPQALLHNMKHNLVLHERNVVLCVRFHEEPTLSPERRVEVEAVAPGFWQVILHFGFMDQPDIPAALQLCAPLGLPIDAFATSYFLSRETVVPVSRRPMPRWRQNLFEAMSRNAGRAVDFFGIPHNAVIELGTRVQL